MSRNNNIKKNLLIGFGVVGLTAVAGLTTDNATVSANGVNDYINSKNWPVNNSNKQIREWLNHRSDVDMNYRHGRPEGVIVHETANSSDKTNPNAIWDEINYMLNHSDSAFVHSFVDANQAVEIADPSLLAWGAGPVGNSRFIQTEQVQVNSKDAFAHELFNLAVLQAQYLKAYNLTPSLGGTVWSHSMISHQLGGSDHTDPDGYWADMAAKYFGTTYTMNDYQTLIEQVFNSMYNSKFKTGAKVQVVNWAEKEANGWNLKDRQNWVGTVKSVKANNASVSHYEYYIDYGNGVRSEHVLEQDLQTAPNPKYSTSAPVQIVNWAEKEANGWNLKDHRNWLGTIKSVAPVNKSNSKWEYYITYLDGSRNEHVLEQDVVPATPAKYKAGQTVQIYSGAEKEANGWNLKDHQNWIGTIKSVKANNASVSHYEYYIEYPDGSRNEHVLEQDVRAPQSAKFKAGQAVQIYSGAEKEANGWNLKDHQNWIGTIKSVKTNNASVSHYEYYIQYPDGSRNEHVLEQDVRSAQAAKYAVGQRVKVSGVAENETNGYDLRPHRNWVGTVKKVALANHSSSRYAYWIEYDNGERNENVPEQDVLLP
ncbi:peptidoglycan recognition protein family protein [Weissella confusa]|uniref:peptidoglycan recognition protein family protein n=1 Tax=Weissella confusa TaxID=1583 RepID=UPI0018F20B3D|nr:peptidoglycan recognition family protein [Weissella confusa]MBJ7627288.1 N-acetylmuramoyl-L-alanine amidase [Weissella confusa]